MSIYRLPLTLLIVIGLVAVPTRSAEAKLQFRCRTLLVATLGVALTLAGVQKLREPQVMLAQSQVALAQAELPLEKFDSLSNPNWDLIAAGYLWSSSPAKDSVVLRFRFTDRAMLDWYFFLAEADRLSNGKINERLKADGLPYRVTQNPTSADTLPYLEYYRTYWTEQPDAFDRHAPYLTDYRSQLRFSKLISIALKETVAATKRPASFPYESVDRIFDQMTAEAKHSADKVFPTRGAWFEKIILANSEVSDAPHIPEFDLATLNELRVEKGLAPLVHNDKWTEHLKVYARSYAYRGFGSMGGKVQYDFFGINKELGTYVALVSKQDESSSPSELWRSYLLPRLPPNWPPSTNPFRPEATSISYCYFRGVFFFVVE